MSDGKIPGGWHTDLGLLLLRLVLGVVFIYHGSQKLFGWFEGSGMEGFTKAVEGLGMTMPSAGFNAYAAALSEFGGGILLILGLFVRVAGFFLAATMAVAVFVVHSGAFAVKSGGMEYALTLGVVSVALCLMGGGRLGVGPSLPGGFKRL